MKLWISGVATLLLLTSCTTTTGVREQPHQRLSDVDGNQNSEPVYTASTNESEAGGVEDIELKPGKGTFINEAAALRKLSAVSEDGEIVLNFEGESLQSVIHTILGEVLQETFVIGPGVDGQVTFSTSKPVSRQQLMPNPGVVAALEWCGDGIYRGPLSYIAGSGSNTWQFDTRTQCPEAGLGLRG